MRKAIFPGTFDPFTIGHYSVVERALTFMDEIIIGIGINENKNTYFPIEKREEMIRNLYKDNPRIKVTISFIIRNCTKRVLSVNHTAHPNSRATRM